MFRAVVQEHIPGWKIEEIASDEKVKARKFSYSSQVYLLMLSQFLHLFSLNEIVDVSKIYPSSANRTDTLWRLMLSLRSSKAGHFPEGF